MYFESRLNIKILILTQLFISLVLIGQTDYNKKWLEAVTNYKNKKFKDALEVLNQITKENNFLSDSIFYLRASCHFELDEFNLSISDLNRCVNLNRNHHEAYFLIGLIKSKKKNYTGAIRSFSRAIKLAPTIPKYYYDRGVAYLREEDIDDAITDFNMAIELKSDYAAAFFSRGYSNDLLGKTAEAILDLKKSIELDNKNKFAYIELSLIFAKLKDTKQCCQVLKEGLNRGCEIPSDIYSKYCE